MTITKERPVSGKRASAQRGVALLEVLIVFFVLSVGLLGMAAMQVKGMQYNQSAYLRSQATVLAYDAMDRLRLMDTTQDNSSAMATEMGLEVGKYLPGGLATVSYVDPVYTIKISWNAPVEGGTVSVDLTSQL